jgi:ribonuclease HII
MERAVQHLGYVPDIALIDAITCDLECPQIGLIDGDAISTSIAAASIMAKTERDHLMQAYHERDSRYQFHRHVGYGTGAHLAAIRAHGPCAIHRVSFRGVLRDTELG